MNYKILRALILMVTASLPVMTFSQQSTESRLFEKSFAVNSDMSLDVTNKYGKIHLSPGSGDSISIRVELVATAPTTSRLRKMIDGVNIELESTNYFVIAETRFERGPANLLEGIRSLTNNLISSESQLQIDYYITVPEYINVKIDNRYGDIFIESMEANLNIKIVNGDLKGEDLLGESTFDLSFCNADIAAVRKSKISISYGELEIDRADDLRINSISSRINLGTTEKLSVDSKRDRFYIKSVSSLTGGRYFTDFDIRTLKDRLDMTTKYGNLDVALFPKSFSLISVESSYTAISLSTEPDASFTFDARLASCYSTIPEHWVVDEKLMDSEKSEYFYTGEIGNRAGSRKILLKMNRGKLLIDQPV